MCECAVCRSGRVSVLSCVCGNGDRSSAWVFVPRLSAEAQARNTAAKQAHAETQTTVKSAHTQQEQHNTTRQGAIEFILYMLLHWERLRSACSVGESKTLPLSSTCNSCFQMLQTTDKIEHNCFNTAILVLHPEVAAMGTKTRSRQATLFRLLRLRGTCYVP